MLAAYDSGELSKALEVEGGFKKWANALGKAQKRKGKRLFMPLRIALTVSPQNLPEVMLYVMLCVCIHRMYKVHAYGAVPVARSCMWCCACMQLVCVCTCTMELPACSASARSS